MTNLVDSSMNDKAYKKYVVITLMTVYAYSFVDRQILGLLMESIKTDLSLSDTELGLLTGLAFAVFYAVLGVPIARLADRGNRVAIISASVTLWSLLVACCGLASSFMQLLFLRIGIGVGEAGCLPASHSLLADYFKRHERPRAMSIFMMGSTLSFLIGYLCAGWLNDLYGWRLTFIILGLPGVVLGLVVMITINEPRKKTIVKDLCSVSPPSVRLVASTLWRTKSLRNLLMVFTIGTFFSFGILQWQPAYLIRTFGTSTTELGFYLALIWGVGGSAGTYLGGWLATRFAAGRERFQLLCVAAVTAFSSAVSVGIYLVEELSIALLLLLLNAVLWSVFIGPFFATLQSLVGDQMRATSLALIYLIANLLGMGFGPLAIGMLSDLFSANYADDSLRYALMIMSPGYLWMAFHMWRASVTVQDDIAMTAKVSI